MRGKAGGDGGASGAACAVSCFVCAAEASTCDGGFEGVAPLKEEIEGARLVAFRSLVADEVRPNLSLAAISAQFESMATVENPKPGKNKVVSALIKQNIGNLGRSW